MDEKESRKLAVTKETFGTIPVEDIKKQIGLIQDLMHSVMKEGQHYGVIPGCDKPSLLKPGAEKLALTFRLAPQFKCERRVLDAMKGHIEYEITCTLYSATGHPVAEGVGSCSTMESKYRFRTKVTDRLVPKGYWDTRDPAILGGTQCSPKKVKGQWVIVEKIENENIADVYNTVLKMAKKRALVDAILTATAASDIFVQDVEDFEESEKEPEQQKPVEVTVSRVEVVKPTEQPNSDCITEAQRRLIFQRLGEKGITQESFKQFLKEEYGIESTKNIKKSDFDNILYWIENLRKPDDEF